MIQFEDITMQYDNSDAPVFSNFNVVIDNGEFVLLTGESGIGKTTFMKLVMREIDPNEGRIFVFGEDITGLKRRQIPFYRRKIGMVFQDCTLVKKKTVYENVRLAKLVTGGERKSNQMVISSLFRLLGISDLYDSFPDELSGGEKQKVCIARALANSPSLLLADEPTKNLSPEESREIMELFELIHKQGITVVAATHDKESARDLPCREIALGREVRTDGQNGGSEAFGQQ